MPRQGGLSQGCQYASGDFSHPRVRVRLGELQELQVTAVQVHDIRQREGGIDQHVGVRGCNAAGGIIRALSRVTDRSAAGVVDRPAAVVTHRPAAGAICGGARRAGLVSGQPARRPQYGDRARHGRFRSDVRRPADLRVAWEPAPARRSGEAPSRRSCPPAPAWGPSSPGPATWVVPVPRPGPPFSACWRLRGPPGPEFAAQAQVCAREPSATRCPFPVRASCCPFLP